MAMITTEEAKAYLRVDTSDEDALIGGLLAASEKLCLDVARIPLDAWEKMLAAADDEDAEPVSVGGIEYSRGEMAQIRELMKIAILYALGYLFEHREEADHKALTLTLSNILFSVREGVV